MLKSYEQQVQEQNEKVVEWNDYCEKCNDLDSMIFSMNEFDERLYGQQPSDIANLIFYGDFNPNAPLFKFDGYGNLQSGELEDLADLSDPTFIEWVNENYCPF